MRFVDYIERPKFLNGQTIPVSPAFRRWQWEDQEFNVILGYILSWSLASLGYMRPHTTPHPCLKKERWQVMMSR